MQTYIPRWARLTDRVTDISDLWRDVTAQEAMCEAYLTREDDVEMVPRGTRNGLYRLREIVVTTFHLDGVKITNNAGVSMYCDRDWLEAHCGSDLIEIAEQHEMEAA